MKTSLLSAVVAVTLAATTTITSAQQTNVSFTATNTATGLNNYVNIALGMFNSNLGSLDSVDVTINYAQLGGSFEVGAPNPTLDQTVNSAAGRIIIRQATTNTLGFTQIGETTNSVTTTPGMPFTVVGGGSQVFTVDPLTALTSVSQSINSSFWDAYSTPGGAGEVVFQVKNRPQISVSGGDFSLTAADFTVETSMTVTYTYTIPEPSTYALLALSALGLAGYQWRRRRA